jgi:hypothetical protein
VHAFVDGHLHFIGVLLLQTTVKSIVFITARSDNRCEMTKMPRSVMAFKSLVKN